MFAEAVDDFLLLFFLCFNAACGIAGGWFSSVLFVEIGN